MKKSFAFLVLIFCVVFLSQALVAETVHLKDGTRISGKVTDRGDRVEVDTGYGLLTIDKSEIARIETGAESAPASPAAVPKTAQRVKEAILDSITSKELSDHVHYLASNQLEGRGTGDEGGKMARDYIVKQFKSYGLKPGGDSETYTQEFPTRFGDSWNVIGYIEGSDPIAHKQVVVVGAHYDHLGRGKYASRLGSKGKGKIHPGADDNASGTAGVLEIAEGFVEGGIKPKRTVVFICFGAEEIGLVGSRYYCEHPRFPLENTVAMFQMDMIARNEPGKVIIFGLSNSAQLSEIVDKANGSEMTVHKAPMSYGSDHYSFYVKGVPALFIHSGMHKDLHCPTDTADKCDFKKAEKIAELVALTTTGAADYRGRIEMEKPKGGGGRRGRGPRGRRLGITPEPAELDKATREKFGLGEKDAGLLIRSVSPDSVAAKGGLKEGDIIIELNGEKLPSGDMRRWLMRLIWTAEKGREIPYTVIRNGEKKTGILTFQ